MKKLLVLVLMLAMTQLASGAIIFDFIPGDALPGATITISLVANDGEQVSGAMIALLTDNGGAAGTKIGSAAPGSWDAKFTTKDSGYNGSAVGYGAGDLVAASGYTAVGLPATGTLYSYNYTIAATAVNLEVINFTIHDIAAYGWVSDVTLEDGSKIVPADFAVTVVPEPMTIALLGLGGLFLLRRRR